MVIDNCEDEEDFGLETQREPTFGERRDYGSVTSDLFFFPAADDCRHCAESVPRDVFDSQISHTCLLPLTEGLR